MKTVLLIGLGRFGMTIAEKLNEMRCEVMAVDRDETRVNQVLPLVTDAQIGDATQEEFLRSLGVGQYDVCFVAIGEDFQSSLEITSLLKDLGAKKVVSRACREVHEKFLLRNGADAVVFPEKQVAAWAAVRHTADHVLDFIDLEGDYGIYEVQVPADWLGRSVGELDVRRSWGVNIIAVQEPGKPSFPAAYDTVFSPGQSILVLGKWKDVQRCFGA